MTVSHTRTAHPANNAPEDGRLGPERGPISETQTENSQPWVYHGVTGPSRAGQSVSVETEDGSPIRALEHLKWHSPSGFAWGYSGSGPADLARSLLLDALGDAARCPGCQGSGQVMTDIQSGNEEPYHPDEPGIPLTDRRRILTCWACRGDGVLTVPYQQFKWAVVARLEPEWHLSRDEVLNWLRCNR